MVLPINGFIPPKHPHDVTRAPSRVDTHTPHAMSFTARFANLVSPVARCATGMPTRARHAVVARIQRAMFASGGDGNNITEDLMNSMRGKISDGLEADSVVVRDESGNGRHVSIKVVSKMFEGKSSVNRQRMVYKTIWMELEQGPVHAVNEMVTLTPDEAAK